MARCFVAGVYLAASWRLMSRPSAWSVRERVLLALVVSLALVAGLLLRRHRLTTIGRLAAERRQLSIAVNNIPQGLVLYDGSARIIICNQHIWRCSACRRMWPSRAAPCSG